MFGRKTQPAPIPYTPVPTWTGPRCMIYRCTHAWSDIPDPGGYVGTECLKCGEFWDRGTRHSRAAVTRGAR